MSEPSAVKAGFPICQHINISFSPYEDRLVVKAERAGDAGPAALLLTRRMVILVLQEVLRKLPELTGLDKTPGMYWQEVLQMEHQKAMQAKAAGDKAIRERKAAEKSNSVPDPSVKPADDKESGSAASVPEAMAVFLGTELTVHCADKRLTLAFKGLPMPHAMLNPASHQPVFALPLQVENLMQLIQLLIAKCSEAKWHLPVDLPWLQESGAPVADSAPRTAH